MRFRCLVERKCKILQRKQFHTGDRFLLWVGEITDLEYWGYLKLSPMSSRDEHGSGLDRTGSGLKPIFGGSGLDRPAIFFKIGGSGLDWTQKIFVVLMWLFWQYQKFYMWSNFTGLLNGCVCFAIKCKNATGTIFQFELYPPLFTYNVQV